MAATQPAPDRLLTLSEPDAVLNPDQWDPCRPTGPVKRLMSASFTRRRSGISPAPSRFGWRVCIETTLGSGTRKENGDREREEDDRHPKRQVLLLL
jgi:hypothetical protein